MTYIQLKKQDLEKGLWPFSKKPTRGAGMRPDIEMPKNSPKVELEGKESAPFKAATTGYEKQSQHVGEAAHVHPPAGQMSLPLHPKDAGQTVKEKAEGPKLDPSVGASITAEKAKKKSAAVKAPKKDIVVPPPAAAKEAAAPVNRHEKRAAAAKAKKTGAVAPAAPAKVEAAPAKETKKKKSGSVKAQVMAEVGRQAAAGVASGKIPKYTPEEAKAKMNEIKAKKKAAAKPKEAAAPKKAKGKAAAAIASAVQNKEAPKKSKAKESMKAAPKPTAEAHKGNLVTEYGKTDPEDVKSLESKPTSHHAQAQKEHEEHFKTAAKKVKEAGSEGSDEDRNTAVRHMGMATMHEHLKSGHKDKAAKLHKLLSSKKEITQQELEPHL